MLTVGLYKDQGVHPLSYRQLRSSLLELKVQVIPLNAEQIIAGNWQKEVDLIAIGGGADVPYHNKLSGKGCKSISSFVEQGGLYLGICAGAYFGCQAIQFDKDGPQEVIEKRELGFFPGMATGPAYTDPPYDATSQSSAQIPPILWFDETVLPVYFNGGCLFVDAHLQENVSILARYIDLPKEPAAAVLCQKGKGYALLCGTHPEYDSHLLPNQKHLLSISKTLEKTQDLRKKIVLKLFQTLLQQFQ